MRAFPTKNPKAFATACMPYEARTKRTAMLLVNPFSTSLVLGSPGRADQDCSSRSCEPAKDLQILSPQKPLLAAGYLINPWDGSMILP